MKAWIRPLLIALTISLGMAGTTSRAASDSVDELLKKGDVFDDKLQPAEALKYYMPAEKAAPDNVKVLTRIARQYRHLMADAPSRDEKLRLGNVSLDYANRAAAAGPNDSEAQLSPAISYGKMLPLLGTREQINASPKIKNAAETAIRLDSRNDLAWHILGRWHRVVSDVSGLKKAIGPLIYGKLPAGSIQEAARCLQKAIEINPNRLMHYIELGRVYAQMGQDAEAKRLINKGLSMPNMEKDDAESKIHGRETLEKLR